ncbi:hypothetical protein QE152_g40844 [Popillia japonica]|uniref:Uncharacterized protein n=1 Tax=Popillia japonica TaxID=7064 RepID=A0AAW1HF81_POPJA
MSIVDDLDDILTRFAEITIFDDMAQINLSMRDYCETIPHFDGDPLNISTFISSCDSFVHIARPNDAEFNSFLFRAIISTLKAIDFEERCLNQLSLLTARNNVTEQNAALRQNKIDLYRGLALQTFINGLRQPMRVIMQCRTPANLEEALNYAQEQENLQMQKHRQTYMFKTNPPKSAHPPQKSFIPVTVPKFVIPQPTQQNFHNNLNRPQHKFHIFDFNPNYDGLIGLDLLKELNATIDLKNNRLLTRNAVRFRSIERIKRYNRPKKQSIINPKCSNPYSFI